MLFSGLHVGRYRLEHLIAEGGTSEVWSARHRVVGHRRAVKVLRQSSPSERGFVDGQPLQATLRHPNVLPVVEIVQLEDRPVLVMPLVEGPSLRALIASRSLSAGQARSLFAGILDGVEAVHEAGLVHCDLKPDNVLLVRDGDRIVPKITDFGIALRLDEPEPLDWGTRPYVAPEQRAGALPTFATDYFALGVILHELLTGRRPGPAIAASIRDPWGPLLERLLEADPAARLCRAREVRDRLDATEVARAPLLRSSLGGGEVVVPGESTAPTAAVRRPDPGALPGYGDAFVGREALLGAVAEALDAPGVVTLLGPAGIGKTRLAVEVARSLDELDVSFVDCAEARTSADVVREVGAALGMSMATPGSRGAVVEALRARGALVLVLDNVEHVAEAIRPLVETWRQRATALRLLTTSREPLDVEGERQIVVPQLARESDEAVELLRSRMATAAPDRDLSAVPRSVLEAIADLLDGLPLAIELAAARVTTLDPEVLLGQLSDRFRVLVSRESGRHDRHRTLEGALDWSWSRLDATEQQALAQLGVFEGGFELEAAEAVLDVPGAPVEVLLEALVAKSLVVLRHLPGVAVPRLSLLLSVQDYARARLAELGGGAAAELRHATWFARNAREEHFMVEGGVAREREARRNLDNLRVAFRRCVARGAGGVATDLAIILVRIGREIGLLPGLLPDVEGLVGVPGARKPRALQLLGAVLSNGGRVDDAVARFEEAVALAREQGDVRIEMIAQLRLGTVLWSTNHPSRARAPLEAAQRLADRLGHPAWQAAVCASLSPMASKEGDEASAIRHAERGLALAQQTGDRALQATFYNHLGVSASRETDHARTRGFYDEALAIHRELGNLNGEGWVLQNLAALDLADGRPEDATRHLELAFERFRQVGAMGTIARRKNLEAGLRWKRGDRDGALRSCSEGESVLRELGDEQGLGWLLVTAAKLRHQSGHPLEARASLDEARDLIGHLKLGFVQEMLRDAEETLARPP